MFIVQRANDQPIMKSARADQAVEEADPIAETILAIPFPRGGGNGIRRQNQRILLKLRFQTPLFLTIAATPASNSGQ